MIGRLARREFPLISEQLAYGFRDVHDHLVRLSDEAMFFQDRITSILDAHLSAVSNQLNQVMKVLTIIATLFMPLTVLTGVYGMNVPLPHLPGGERAQFWWVLRHHVRHVRGDARRIFVGKGGYDVAVRGCGSQFAVRARDVH